MTTPDDSTTNNADSASPGKTLLQRIPRHLFGGRLRTTTAVLLIAFVGVLVLYGQRADHYKAIDEQNAAASATRTAAPRTTEETPEYTAPATTRSSLRSSSSAPSTTSTTGTDQTSPTDGSQPTTTTTAPGFQLPTIPGLVLPGQTPTTTPAR
ncbi:hypothetical protein [Williamsia sp. M5A3_1d]